MFLDLLMDSCQNADMIRIQNCLKDQIYKEMCHSSTRVLTRRIILYRSFLRNPMKRIVAVLQTEKFMRFVSLATIAATMHSSFRTLEDIKNNCLKTLARAEPPTARLTLRSHISFNEARNNEADIRMSLYKAFFEFQERIVSSEIAVRLGNRNNWQPSKSHLLHEI